uniref:Uncharacterized protein n=1 Tax=Knipowitschia caucasica TaxID=637954 RepID=A0AAV2LTS7_KNICA
MLLLYPPLLPPRPFLEEPRLGASSQPSKYLPTQPPMIRRLGLVSQRATSSFPRHLSPSSQQQRRWWSVQGHFPAVPGV